MAEPPFTWAEKDYDETLSFASLLQQGKEGERGSPTRLLPGDPDFEFHSIATSNPPSATTLFPNAQLPPRPLPTPGSVFCTSSSRRTSRSSSRGSSASRSGGGSRRRDSGSRASQAEPGRLTSLFGSIGQVRQFFWSGRSAAALPSSSSSPGGSSRRRTIGAVAMPAEAKPPRRVMEKQRQGLLGSFTSACKVCHAVEPTKQAKSNIYVT